MYKEIYDKESAHAITEADKSQDLQSQELENQESWWCRPSPKACSLETQKDVSVWDRRQESTSVPAQGSQAGGVPSFLHEGQPFGPILTFNWLDETHPRWEM